MHVSNGMASDLGGSFQESNNKITKADSHKVAGFILIGVHQIFKENNEHILLQKSPNINLFHFRWMSSIFASLYLL